MIYTGRKVTHLSYESYTSLAIKTMLKIINEARTHHTSTLQASDSKIVIHHLLGECPVGETSIIIGVSSAQRVGAFELCQLLLEQIKKEVQIWKQEHYDDDDGEPCWKENFPSSDSI
ncbi:Molybdopterin biosynthesis MoaE [Melampsora americana]|nr:Molybdopterin biosynthesis MoaE [Melampsora americana]